MKWKIAMTASGAYKLTPLTGEANNRVLALEVGTLGIANSNGDVLQQRDYVDDTNYKDEWLLIGNVDSTFVAIPETDHPHEDSFPSVLISVENMGFSTNRTFTQVDAADVATYIATSRIFYSRSHGYTTYLQLNYDAFSKSTLANSPYTLFENCELVLYGACLTGEGRTNADNLVNTTHEYGAQTVIGFEKSVYCSEMNIWAEAFFDALSSGSTVTQACYSALASVKARWSNTITTDSWYIAGDENATFS